MKREDIVAVFANPNYRTSADRVAFLATHFDYFEISDQSPFKNYYISRVKQGWKVGKNECGNHSWLIEPTLDSAIDALMEGRELLTEDEHEEEARRVG
jgi:hypothetical protein